MSIKLNIKNEETGTAKVAIIVFSDHSTPYVLKSGEDVIIQAYHGRTISIVESEEDYSHGEKESSLFVPPPYIMPSAFVEEEDLQTGTVVNQDGNIVSPAEIPIEFYPKESE